MEHESEQGSVQAIRSHTTYRNRGVPGSGVNPTQYTEARDLETSLRFTSAHHHFLDHALSLDVGADVLYSSRSFHDPGAPPDYLPELSMRAEQSAGLWQVGLDSRVLWDISLAQRIEISPRIATTYFVQSGEENQTTAALSGFSRLSLDVGVGLEYLWTPIEGLTFGPGIRFDAWLPGTSDAFQSENRLPQISPRLILHWDLGSWGIYVNAGRRHRFPTLLAF